MQTAQTKKNPRANQKRLQSQGTLFPKLKEYFNSFEPLFALGIIILLILVHYFPMFFDGKTFVSSDIIATSGPKNPLPPESRLWNPYIWGGMPGSTVNFWYNLITLFAGYARSIWAMPFAINYANWTFFFVLLALNTYLLMKYLTKSFIVSIFTALTTIMSTGIVLYIMIGHVSKLAVLAWFPLAFLLILKLQKQFKWTYLAWLVVALQQMLQPWHVQVIFYCFLFLGVYFVYFIARNAIIKNNIELKENLKGLGYFVGALTVALLISINTYANLYEYAKFSTRGSKSILEQNVDKIQDPKLKSDTKNAENDQYNYNTNWSFSPGEIMTFIVPSYYGFGNSTYDGELTNGVETEVNTYFGQMPFVDVAQYMGVIVLILALLAFVVDWKNPFVQFLGVISLISLFISFGRNLPFLYNIFYHLVPGFNKFRVPSMILLLLQIALPILAGFSLKRIIDIKNGEAEVSEKSIVNYKKYIYYASIVFAALLVLSFVLNGVLKSGFIERAAGTAKGKQLEQLHTYMSDMYIKDLWLALFFMASTLGLIWAYINDKISKGLMLGIILVFSVVDLYRIDKRGENYKDFEEFNSTYNEPDYIKALKDVKDKSAFRIMNLKQDGSIGSLNNNANFHEKYRIQDLYGYSAIKPRAIQDFMDVVGPVNNTLWKMLNVKYIVADKMYMFPGISMEPVRQGSDFVLFRNNDAAPRAYFVDSVRTANPLDFLYMVKENKFEPRRVAYVHDEAIKVDVPESDASVKIQGYEPDKIVIKAKATGNNFMFIGDTYYPHGWKATIDGQETKIIRTNHGFRGLIIPKGDHVVELVYLPTSFVIAKYLALIFSFFVICGIGYGCYEYYKKELEGKLIKK